MIKRLIKRCEEYKDDYVNLRDVFTKLHKELSEIKLPFILTPSDGCYVGVERDIQHATDSLLWIADNNIKLHSQIKGKHPKPAKLESLTLNQINAAVETLPGFLERVTDTIETKHQKAIEDMQKIESFVEILKQTQ
jgi:hypothetical protein